MPVEPSPFPKFSDVSRFIDMQGEIDDSYWDLVGEVLRNSNNVWFHPGPIWKTSKRQRFFEYIRHSVSQDHWSYFSITFPTIYNASSPFFITGEPETISVTADDLAVVRMGRFVNYLPLEGARLHIDTTGDGNFDTVRFIKHSFYGREGVRLENALDFPGIFDRDSWKITFFDLMWYYHASRDWPYEDFNYATFSEFMRQIEIKLQHRNEHLVCYSDAILHLDYPDFEGRFSREYDRNRLNYKGILQSFFDQPTQYKDILFTLLENKPKEKKSVYAAIGKRYGRLVQSLHEDLVDESPFTNPFFRYKGGRSWAPFTHPPEPISWQGSVVYYGDQFVEQMGAYFWTIHRFIWDVQLSEDSWITVGSHDIPPVKNAYWKWGLSQDERPSYESNYSKEQFGYGVNNMHYSFRRPQHRLPWKYFQQYGNTFHLPNAWTYGEVYSGYSLYGTHHPQAEVFVVVELRDEFGQFSGSVGDQGIAYWTGHENSLPEVPFVDPGLEDSIGEGNTNKLGNFYTGLPNEKVSDSVRAEKLVPLEVYNILSITDTQIKILRNLLGMHIYQPSEDLTTVATSKIELSWVWDEVNNPADKIVVKRVNPHILGYPFEFREDVYPSTSQSFLDFFDHLPWEQILENDFSDSPPSFGDIVETVYNGSPPLPESDGSLRISCPPILMTDLSIWFKRNPFIEYVSTGELVQIGNELHDDLTATANNSDGTLDGKLSKILHGNDGDYVTDGNVSQGVYAGYEERNSIAYYFIVTRDGKTHNPEDFFLKRKEIEINFSRETMEKIEGYNLGYHHASDPLYDPRDAFKKDYKVSPKALRLATEFQLLNYLTFYMYPVHQFAYTAYPPGLNS